MRIAAVICLAAFSLSGCAAYDVGSAAVDVTSTAVDVTTTAVSTTAHAVGYVVTAPFGSSDSDKKKDD
jgi:hypothetical protein